MADRDGLKPASAYPEAIYLQRTHEDGSEMLYPHDATWTETSDCGYDIKYLRADLASPQPAPHAIPHVRPWKDRLKSENATWMENCNAMLNEIADLRALLAQQPAASDVQDAVIGKYDDVLKPFMAMMETELHANSGKGDRPGWLSMSRAVGMLEIYYHVAKLQKAVKDDNSDAIREHSADVANMSMMIADICGVLPIQSTPAVHAGKGESKP